MRNNLQPKCRMPWERAGVTLQGPGLSNCASLLNRLLCFSIHFIQCYSSASAFLSPLPLLEQGNPYCNIQLLCRAQQGKVFWHHRPAIKGHCPPLLQQLLHICTSVQNKATKLSKMQYKALQLYSINANDQLQLHCDLCTVPVSQLVENAPPQSL